MVWKQVVFPYIMSKLELIDCTNIDVICKSLCYTYRFDTSDQIRVQFPDPGSRVTFYCLETPNVHLTVDKVKWERPDTMDQSGDVVEDDSKNEEDENMNGYPDSLQYVVPYAKGDRQRLSVRWKSAAVPEFSSKVIDESLLSNYTAMSHTNHTRH